MTYHGHVKDGAIQLDDPGALPEGATVTVEVTQKIPVRSGRSRLTMILDKAHAWSAAHGIPAFYVVLILFFMVSNYLMALDDEVYLGCVQVLLIDDVKSTDDLTAELSYLNPRKGPTRESRHTDGAQAFNLFFPWYSSYHLCVDYAPETKEILDYRMYMESEVVDLTARGAGATRRDGWTAVFALVAVLMSVLFYLEPRCGWLLRHSVYVFIAFTILPMAFLAFIMAFWWVFKFMDVFAPPPPP